MLTIITGTPGTGKTTVCSLLKNKIDATFISINSLIKEYDLTLGVDDARGYKIVDTQKMIPIIDKIKEDNIDKDIIFEGHIAQDYPNADKIICLRCNPLILEERLNTRDWSDKKINENISSEILGVCTSESYETYQDNVQEIDTSHLSADEISDIIIDIINNKEIYPLGEIDFLSEYYYLIQ